MKKYLSEKNGQWVGIIFLAVATFLGYDCEPNGNGLLILSDTGETVQAADAVAFEADLPEECTYTVRIMGQVEAANPITVKGPEGTPGPYKGVDFDPYKIDQTLRVPANFPTREDLVKYVQGKVTVPNRTVGEWNTGPFLLILDKDCPGKPAPTKPSPKTTEPELIQH